MCFLSIFIKNIFYLIKNLDNIFTYFYKILLNLSIYAYNKEFYSNTTMNFILLYYSYIYIYIYLTLFVSLSVPFHQPYLFILHQHHYSYNPTFYRPKTTIIVNDISISSFQFSTILGWLISHQYLISFFLSFRLCYIYLANFEK